MKYLHILFLVAFHYFIIAQTPVLVKDINPGPLSSTPNNHPHLQINDVIYFVGDNNNLANRRDLYSIKNGEVQLITSMCSSSCNFFEVFFFSFENKLFFVKRIDNKFNQLWSTDGTVAGTSMILDYPGAFRSFGVGNNGKVYLTVYNRNSFKDEVYISDGTSSGSKKNINRTKLRVR
jgi:ELWxxDGT repeat protein